MVQRHAAVGVASALLAASVLAVPPAVSAAPAAAKEPTSTPQVSPRSSSKVWLFDSPRRAALPVSAAGAAPSVPKGTGPVRNGTQVAFSLTDRLEAKVNVGSGNLVLSTDLTLPGVAGNVTLGAAFNSLMLGSDLAVGAHGPGWRTRSGQDVKHPADDGSVTYAAADGVVGKFTASGSAYTSPGEFKATLAHNGTGGS